MRASTETALAFCQPRLRVAVGDEQVVAPGELLVPPLAPENGDVGTLATYQVRIALDPPFPAVEPVATETGNAIPRSDTRHLNGAGTCDVLAWDSWKTTAPDVSITAYVDGPLRNSFPSQRQVALGGDWPFGEWDHGADGLVTAYQERLGCRPDRKLLPGFLRELQGIHRRRSVPPQWHCPGGSQRTTGCCCRPGITGLLGTISANDARSTAKRTG